MYFLLGDVIDTDSCADERMVYHGNTTLSLCVDWANIFQGSAFNSVIERDVLSLDNFPGDALDNLGSKCR